MIKRGGSSPPIWNWTPTTKWATLSTSYRLILPDCLPCKRGNGVLDNDEFRMMGEEILSYTENEDVRVGSLINVVLNDLRISSKHHDLSFVNKKEWNKFTKPQVGTVIACAWISLSWRSTHWCIEWRYFYPILFFGPRFTTRSRHDSRGLLRKWRKHRRFT